MCKKPLSVLVLLLSGVWANAQQSPPGYAVLTSNQGSAGVQAGPPEPAPLGGPGGGGPRAAVPGMGMGYPAGPGMGPPMGMGYPAAPGMGYPPGMPPGATGALPGYPAGGPGDPMAGGMPAGYPPPGAVPYGMDAGAYGAGPVMGGDVLSTFGTETFFFDIGYVAAFVQQPRLNAPLVTYGSVNDIHPGALGQPGTTIAYGDGNYKNNMYSGITAALGVNLNDSLYLEVNALILPTQTHQFRTTSDLNGNPLIARPVFNTATNDERSYITSIPGVVVGSSAIETRSQIWGFEAAARYKVNLTPYLTGDALIGYRQMELVESLTINDVLIPQQQSITFLGNAVLPPNSVTDQDRFATNNQFHGVDLGGRLRWQSGYDWFAMSAYGKVAMGATYQTVDIAGATALNTPGAPPMVTSGGVLAQPSNIGSYSRSVFGVIPEGGVNFIFTPWKYVRFQVGYSALYWNNVVRPGNQIDHRVNPGQVPTELNYIGPGVGGPPSFSFKPQGMTIQTINVGLQIYY